MADPGFPVGERPPRGGGAPTPEAATFRKICMSKRKNLDPWGGGGGGRAPAVPPGSANDIVKKVRIRSRTAIATSQSQKWASKPFLRLRHRNVNSPTEML